MLQNLFQMKLNFYDLDILFTCYFSFILEYEAERKKRDLKSEISDVRVRFSYKKNEMPLNQGF